MAGRQWPEDVVRDILSRLPVKSLMRFRCVCKPWCNLIKSPSFIAQHLNRASTRKTVIVKRSLQHDHRNVLSIISDHDQTETNTDIDIDTMFPKDEMYILLFGSCNGILCITHNYSDSIVLCNPSIREFKVVPDPLFTYSPCLTGYTQAVGFGFDPNTDDYKVVRIVGLYLDDGFYYVHSYKIEVYNLSTNSWREINNNDAIVSSQFDYIPLFATIVNGALHWFAFSITGLDSSILSFHISNEVTQMIPLPDTLPSEYPKGYSYNLIALNESSLALVLRDLSKVDDHFDIWVMNEYGVKESWTRHFKIGPLSNNNQPFVFWNNGSELLMENSNGQLVSCNLQDQNVKEFPVHGDPNTLSVVTYSESLVSINSENEIEESA